MKKTDVLVIGGSAAGLVAAMTAKLNNSDKHVTVIRKEEIVMIPCGIPYVYGTTGSTNKNVLPDTGLINLGVDIIVDEVVSINKEEKTCKTKKGEEFEYDKLVFATGSTPAVPRWLKGTDLENVFTVPKDKVYLDAFQDKLEGLNKVVTIGAGFIGVEMSDELNKAGKEVHLVEKLPCILGSTFDKEIVEIVEGLLTERGVKLHTGLGVKEILGDGKVTGVLLENGETIEADAVIVSMGYRPNTKLAEETGLALNERGFIKADQFRRTECKDIFAAGDCASKTDFITGKLSGIMLASTACTEARIAGMNLYNLSIVKTFPGTIGVYSTCIGETAIGAAGLIERMAENEGIEVVVGSFTGIDRHPGHIKDTHKQTVKLIVSKDSGVLLGGEVIGGKSAGELINVVGFAIQNRMTVSDLLTVQISTQPVLTASPAAYPLVKAAEIVARKLK